jgi:hypothetical protein
MALDQVPETCPSEHESPDTEKYSRITDQRFTVATYRK